jgi:hypothetical protein
MAEEGSLITPEPCPFSCVSPGIKTILATTGPAAVLLLPTGVMAKPDQPEKDAAKAECKAQRGKSKATRDAFKAKFDDTNCNGRSAFGRCVSRRTQGV